MLFQPSWRVVVLGCTGFEFLNERLACVVWTLWSLFFNETSLYLGLVFQRVVDCVLMSVVVSAQPVTKYHAAARSPPSPQLWWVEGENIKTGS